MSIIMRLLLAAILELLIPCASYASQMLEPQAIEIKYLQQVRLNIASDAVNRISFDNFVVTKLIGNIGSFDSILSDTGSDLFIAPKLQAGKRIDFSALLASGDVIDFSLLVIKSETPALVKLKFPSTVIGVNKSEAVRMIEAMHEGKTGKYYVQKLFRKINIPSHPEIKAVAQNSYRFKDLCGTSLLLENTSKKRSLEITANDLSGSFNKVAAIHIKQGFLAPKGQTKAYIVFKGGLE